MNSRAHPKYKTKYRVENWPEYERALVRRADITRFENGFRATQVTEESGERSRELIRHKREIAELRKQVAAVEVLVDK